MDCHKLFKKTKFKFSFERDKMKILIKKHNTINIYYILTVFTLLLLLFSSCLKEKNGITDSSSPTDSSSKRVYIEGKGPGGPMNLLGKIFIPDVSKYEQLSDSNIVTLYLHNSRYLLALYPEKGYTDSLLAYQTIDNVGLTYFTITDLPLHYDENSSHCCGSVFDLYMVSDIYGTELIGNDFGIELNSADTSLYIIESPYNRTDSLYPEVVEAQVSGGDGVILGEIKIKDWSDIFDMSLPEAADISVFLPDNYSQPIVSLKIPEFGITRFKITGLPYDSLDIIISSDYFYFMNKYVYIVPEPPDQAQPFLQSFIWLEYPFFDLVGEGADPFIKIMQSDLSISFKKNSPLTDYEKLMLIEESGCEITSITDYGGNTYYRLTPPEGVRTKDVMNFFIYNTNIEYCVAVVDRSMPTGKKSQN
jgi:hypothetical protein